MTARWKDGKVTRRLGHASPAKTAKAYTEPKGNTPMRAMRISDEIWSAASERARAEDTNVTALVVAFLTEYGNGA